MRIDIALLSKMYTVRKIEDTDIQDVYHLCKKNPRYYYYCPPDVTIENLKEDLIALPPNKTMDDKCYFGFYDGNKLVAVMDLIDGYPEDEIAWIGFFMMEADLQGQGVGSKIIDEVCKHLKFHFTCVRLGYIDGNKQPEHFWTKNHFVKTGQVSHKELYDIVVMQRNL